MALHLLKLCVGAESIEDQQEWCDRRREQRVAEGLDPRHFHVTRMVPKRIDELLDGGSLYWVIKGNIQARQTLLDIEPFTDGDGIRRCRLFMGDEVIPTAWSPKRAFQGWRYLIDAEAPADLTMADASVPLQLKVELAELGLL